MRAEIPGAAVRVYEELEEALNVRFCIAPKAETRAAAQGRAATSARPAVATGATTLLWLQVLAFRSEEGAAAPLLESFRSEILASLACFRGWVIAEGAQPDAGARGRPDYQLEATAGPGPSQTEVALKLTEVPSRRVVWSDRVVIGSGKFISAERATVARIAAALEVYLSTDRLQPAQQDPEHSVVDDGLRAEHLRLSNWTPDAHDAAAAMHERIIARAPDYAPAHASLAGIFNLDHIVRPGKTRDTALGERAYELADRAASLDPLDARSQMVVPWSAALEEDFDKASIHMEMAVRLNPNSPRTLVSCGLGFAFFGEHERAAAALAHALDCSPVLAGYQWCNAASVYYLAGDLEAALKASKRGRNAVADNPGWQAAILTALGRKAEAEAEAAFDRLVATVSPVWAGHGPPTREAVYDWFIRAYPLRHEAERAKLAFGG